MATVIQDTADLQAAGTEDLLEAAMEGHHPQAVATEDPQEEDMVVHHHLVADTEVEDLLRQAAPGHLLQVLILSCGIGSVLSTPIRVA